MGRPAAESIERKESVIMNENKWSSLILAVIKPVLIYLIVTVIVSFVGGGVMGALLSGRYISESGLDMDGFMTALPELSAKYGLLLQTIAAFISILIFSRMYRRQGFAEDDRENRKAYGLRLLPALIAGVLGALAGNMLLNAVDTGFLSEGYMETERLLFGGSFAVQIAGIGFIIPLCEELLYRGLIYRPMRKVLGVNAAIPVSALIFGIMHGNIFQGIYAFVIGILFAYLMESYRTLAAPVLAHMGGNCLGLLLTRLPELPGKSAFMILGLVSLAGTLLVLRLVDRNVEKA